MLPPRVLHEENVTRRGHVCMSGRGEHTLNRRQQQATAYRKLGLLEGVNELCHWSVAAVLAGAWARLGLSFQMCAQWQTENGSLSIVPAALRGGCPTLGCLLPLQGPWVPGGRKTMGSGKTLLGEQIVMGKTCVYLLTCKDQGGVLPRAISAVK